MVSVAKRGDVLDLFHPAVAEWVRASFAAPTPPQQQGWPAIARGESTLILAPTGSGKTLTAFLWAINQTLFAPAVAKSARILYISPLKALAVDVERNLRAPIAGIANRAAARGDAFHMPIVAVRTGDTPAAERARLQRDPSDILITTPESLYLLLTSNSREALRSVETVIVDEIHALVPTKRGVHLMLSLERLTAFATSPPQRIGLSATQRPLDEVARFLGGASASDQQSVASGQKTKKTSRVRRSPAGHRSPTTDHVADLDHEFSAHRTIHYRPVTIVDAGQKKELALSVQVPVEDM